MRFAQTRKYARRAKRKEAIYLFSRQILDEERKETSLTVLLRAQKLLSDPARAGLTQTPILTTTWLSFRVTAVRTGKGISPMRNSAPEATTPRASNKPHEPHRWICLKRARTFLLLSKTETTISNIVVYHSFPHCDIKQVWKRAEQIIERKAREVKMSTNQSGSSSSCSHSSDYDTRHSVGAIAYASYGYRVSLSELLK